MPIHISGQSGKKMAMYGALTFQELTVLQNVLYEGTEEAFRVANTRGSDPLWFNHYRPVHSEVGRLFIEAGTELLERIDSGHGEQTAA
jgi:hypothetical protein